MKKTGFVAEFRTFISRGNVMDLAVGVIIGAAFQKIVSSLVNDLIMPFVGLFTGGVNFTDQFLILKLPDGVTAEAITSLEMAKTLGVTTFNYGSFLSAVLDFLIVALVVFLLVKNLNRLRALTEKPQPAAPPATKACPYCRSKIDTAATRCPFCTSELS